MTNRELNIQIYPQFRTLNSKKPYRTKQCKNVSGKNERRLMSDKNISAHLKPESKSSLVNSIRLRLSGRVYCRSLLTNN